MKENQSEQLKTTPSRWHTLGRLLHFCFGRLLSMEKIGLFLNISSETFIIIAFRKCSLSRLQIPEVPTLRSCSRQTARIKVQVRDVAKRFPGDERFKDGGKHCLYRSTWQGDSAESRAMVLS